MGLLKAKTKQTSRHAKDQALKEVQKESLVRLNVNIPQTLHRKFKVCSVENGTDMTRLVVQLIEDYVNSKKSNISS